MDILVTASSSLAQVIVTIGLSSVWTYRAGKRGREHSQRKLKTWISTCVFGDYSVYCLNIYTVLKGETYSEMLSPYKSLNVGWYWISLLVLRAVLVSDFCNLSLYCRPNNAYRCPYGRKATNEVSNNNNVYFGSSVGGVANPMLFPFVMWPVGFTILICHSSEVAVKYTYLLLFVNCLHALHELIFLISGQPQN